jgi:hypothetical protein
MTRRERVEERDDSDGRGRRRERTRMGESEEREDSDGRG